MCRSQYSDAMSIPSEPLRASDRLDYWVFPIGVGNQSQNGDIEWHGLCGTGFPISSDGWCLTAAHVLEESQLKVFACFPQDTEFRAHDITDIEIHPREDLAIFRVVNRTMTPLCRWQAGMCHAARDFTAMGYPAYLLKDHGKATGQYGAVLDRPELIVSKGHIRRRISHRLPSFRGQGFAEMSEWLGEGASGGPVVDFAKSSLLGIYLGYKPERMTTENGEGQTIGARGIMLRLDECVDWSPKVLVYRSLRDVLTVAHDPIPR